MAKTRAFKSGNSQAVRIPAEMAFEDINAELTITRLGDVITIIPAGRSLKDAVRILKAMPKPPGIETREPIEVPERERD
jgi:antitoxin VapB